jgi:hypothetical protein
MELSERVLGGLLIDEPGLPGPTTSFDLLREGTEIALRVDGEEWGRWESAPPAVADLLWNVHQAAFRSHPGTVAFHAGSISVGNQRILVPGSSGHGKSSLVLACCRAGAAYGGDEVAWLDLGSRAAVPFPTALSLSLEGLARYEGSPSEEIVMTAATWRTDEEPQRCYLDPHSLGPVIVTEEPLSAIVFREPPGLRAFGLDAIGRADGLHRLYANAQFRWEERTGVFRSLGDLVEEVPLFTANGDAEDLAEAIITRLGGG